MRISSNLGFPRMGVQRELKKAIRQQGKRWKTEIDIGRLPPALALLADPANAAEAQLNDYLAAVGGEVVPASGSVDVSGELLRRYFARESPFENNDKKKYEQLRRFQQRVVQVTVATHPASTSRHLPSRSRQHGLPG